MAATYTISAQNIAFASNKCMVGVFNEVGSGLVVKVYRIWCINNQLVTVTGILTNLEVRKITAASGGTTITPTKHDSNSTTRTGSAGSGMISGTNMAITPTSLYKRVIWSTDEPVANTTATLDEFEVLLPFCCIFSLGYADPNTEPIVLRPGEGCAVVNTGGAIGQADLFMEITVT